MTVHRVRTLAALESPLYGARTVNLTDCRVTLRQRSVPVVTAVIDIPATQFDPFQYAPTQKRLSTLDLIIDNGTAIGRWRAILIVSDVTLTENEDGPLARITAVSVDWVMQQHRTQVAATVPVVDGKVDSIKDWLIASEKYTTAEPFRIPYLATAVPDTGAVIPGGTQNVTFNYGATVWDIFTFFARRINRYISFSDRKDRDGRVSFTMPPFQDDSLPLADLTYVTEEVTSTERTTNLEEWGDIVEITRHKYVKTVDRIVDEQTTEWSSVNYTTELRRHAEYDTWTDESLTAITQRVRSRQTQTTVTTRCRHDLKLGQPVITETGKGYICGMTLDPFNGISTITVDDIETNHTWSQWDYRTWKTLTPNDKPWANIRN